MSIASCGHDEHGACYKNGKAGDQTGTEWYVRKWYNMPANVVLRYPKSDVAKDIATLARHGAENNKIGYDQNQRGTFWTQLSKAKKYDPANIKTACEADCSSSTAAVVKAVGYRLGIPKLKDVSASNTTSTLRKALKNAGFEVLTDKKYLTSDAYLKAGDIVLREGHHVFINLTNGSKASTTSTKGTVYQITASALNYRLGASTTTARKGSYPKGTKVTIVETKVISGKTWGKGTNGYWCCLTGYAKKVG